MGFLDDLRADLKKIKGENQYKDSQGRPMAFEIKYIKEVRDLCLLQKTDEEMAQYFGVALSTFYLWKVDYPAFSDAIKDGQERADGNVANALYKLAVGYKVKETAYEGKAMKVSDADPDKDLEDELNEETEYQEGDEEKEQVGMFLVHKKVTFKNILPNVTAQKFWLINRQRKKFTDTVNHLNDGGKFEAPKTEINLADLSNDVIEAIMNAKRK